MIQYRKSCDIIFRGRGRTTRLPNLPHFIHQCFVRKIQNSIGFSIAGTHLITHEPRDSDGVGLDQIVQEHANFSQSFVPDPEHEAFGAQVEMEEQLVEMKTLDQIEFHGMIPFWVPISLLVCRRSLLLPLLLVQLLIGIIAHQRHNRID